MKVFFICAALFLIFAWIVISVEHNEEVGKSARELWDSLFGKDDDT